MKEKLTKYSILAFAGLAVLYPLWTRLQNLNFQLGPDYLLSIFPFLGLLAFSLLWLHSLAGAFEPWLRKHIQFDRFVHITASIILLCILAHPLLFLVSFGFNFNDIFFYYDAFYIWLAIIGWFLLITYDIGKALKKRDFFAKNWSNILIISNVGFILTFFHSLTLGSDLQSAPLRVIWIFYGITAILAIIYTYAVRPLLNKINSRK